MVNYLLHNHLIYLFIGKLVKVLLKTRVAKYLEWKSIDGTFVYQYQQGGIFSKAGATICKVNN